MRNQDENQLPEFDGKEGSYALSRLAGYRDISGPRANVKTQNSENVGVYVKASKGDYIKDPITMLLRQLYHSKHVSIEVRFK